MQKHTIVLLDANFLINCGELRIDAADEIGKLVPNACLATVTPVIAELSKLGEKTAIALAKHYRLELLNSRPPADKALLEKALQTNAIVCTNDKELKKTCLQASIPVIFVRKNKKLEKIG